MLLLGSSDGRGTSVHCGEKNCCVDEEAHCVMFRSKELMIMLMKVMIEEIGLNFLRPSKSLLYVESVHMFYLCVENETKVMETLLHRRYNWSDRTAESDKYYLGDVQLG